MLKVTPAQSSDLVLEVAEQVEIIDEQLLALDARLTEIVQTVHWDSFSAEHRALIAQWHNSSREARLRLRQPSA